MKEPLIENARQDPASHVPEGVSVMVVAPYMRGDALVEAAQLIAEVEYPGITLTGRTLHVGIDEFKEGTHEVVLEVAQADGRA